MVETVEAGGGHKARAKDEVIEYLKDLLRAGKVGKGYLRLNAAQQKCLLTRKEIQGIIAWWEKQKTVNSEQ